MKSEELVRKAKLKALQLAHHANASHLGGAFSIADVLSVLYSEVLKYNAEDPTWSKRDRMFYSKGHACTILYAILQEIGFFSEEMLDSFSENGSILTMHISHKVPGVELSTGSLGHALGVACGVALAGKIKKETWKTYCVVSDGELNEGSNWEAIMFAAHHKLSNFTLIVDYNKIQSLGFIKDIINLDPLKAKFDAFNFYTVEIDGHNHEQILSALEDGNNIFKPKVIIANTVKGKGIDFMEHQLAWHYKSPNKEQYTNAIKQLEE
jgi:transketolase